MLQMEEARAGRLTDELRAVAREENVDAECLAAAVARGAAVILKNRKSGRRPVGLGPGLRTKVNANIGTSADASSLEEELAKLDAAVAAGADAVMDLSTGGDLDVIRRAILARSTVPVGTVPIYQAAVGARRAGRGMIHMTADEIVGAVRTHAEDGVDFVTVHCGVTLEVAEHARSGRPSRGRGEQGRRVPHGVDGVPRQGEPALRTLRRAARPGRRVRRDAEPRRRHEAGRARRCQRRRAGGRSSRSSRSSSSARGRGTSRRSSRGRVTFRSIS